MTPIEPSRHYTGLVARAYGPLRGSVPDPEPYARFIAAFGEPALELGCGDGDPMLELRRRGLDIEGLDSSADMLERFRARADSEGVSVVLHESAIESMCLGRRYQSIFLAGPTFNLLVNDTTAANALARIAEHLEPTGAALIPLFIPPPGDGVEIGVPRRHEEASGALLKVTTLSVERNEDTRQQQTVLRYEVIEHGVSTVLDRIWVLHWHSQESFRQLATEAGLRVVAVLDPEGQRADPTATEFVFLLAPA